MARALHPDVAGTQSTRAFLEVTEAYKILGDPEARRRHDAELFTWEGPLPNEPVRQPDAPWRWEPVSLMAEPLAVRPSFDTLVETLVVSTCRRGSKTRDPRDC